MREIARILCKSNHLVKRIVAKYLSTPDVKPKKIGHPKDSVAFTDDEQLMLIKAILDHPNKELSEITRDVRYIMGNSYVYSTIHCYLKRNGITRKMVRRQTILLQRFTFNIHVYHSAQYNRFFCFT